MNFDQQEDWIFATFRTLAGVFASVSYAVGFDVAVEHLLGLVVSAAWRSTAAAETPTVRANSTNIEAKKALRCMMTRSLRKGE